MLVVVEMVVQVEGGGYVIEAERGGEQRQGVL
jgi:hypothetical protein